MWTDGHTPPTTMSFTSALCAKDTTSGSSVKTAVLERIEIRL
jgi:hypothetical protein